MATRALIHVPDSARAGEVVEIRALVQHPMESGYRVGSSGQALPRDLIRRFECRLDGVLVFAADLHPAIAANPYLTFTLRATASGTLTFTWAGDNGFAHSASARLNVA